MRKERKVLVKAIIEGNKALDTYGWLADRGLIAERAYVQESYRVDDLKERFLDTYGEEPYGRPLFARSLETYEKNMIDCEKYRVAEALKEA